MLHAIGCVFLASTLRGPHSEPALERFAFAEIQMGTRFEIVLYAADRTAAERAARAAFARVADLDRVMSDFKPDSELMRLCAKAGGAPVRISEELFFVLSRAQGVAGQSDGAFDVTVGPLSRLWRQARKTRRLPEPDDLARAKALVGYRNLVLDATNRTARLLKPGMQLDLGGIGKGYAADEALAVLKKHGVTRALVAAGGDIAVGGPPPGAEGWSVGIAPLEDANRKPTRHLLLHDAAVSTSGDFEQHLEIDGKRYSHIIDPRTGLGLTERLSVTVVAPKGVVADPLTKVVSVLGPRRGMERIEATDGAAALVVRASDGGVETFVSRRFPQIPQKQTVPGGAP
jgi:thiamine biosynthesis lipoprotein